jgi:predicted Ser/Thr protein kinase
VKHVAAFAQRTEVGADSGRSGGESLAEVDNRGEEDAKPDVTARGIAPVSPLSASQSCELTGGDSSAAGNLAHSTDLRSGSEGRHADLRKGVSRFGSRAKSLKVPSLSAATCNPVARAAGSLGRWEEEDWRLEGGRLVIPPAAIRQRLAVPTAALCRTGRSIGSGACGVVELGRIGKAAVALKFTDPRKGLQDLVPLCNEVLKYARLAPLQGGEIPKLVWDGWTGAGAVYGIATSYIQGKNLQDARLSLAEWKVCFRSAEAGLAAIHMLGVVHNDIRSENLVVVARRRVAFLDFGIARRSRKAIDRQQDRRALRGVFSCCLPPA